MNWVLLLLAFASNGEGTVIDRVFDRLAEKDRRIAGVSYFAVYRYEEQDLKTGKAGVLGCTRRVTWERGGRRQEHEFLTVSSNGRELAGRERERGIADLRRKGLMATDSRMPFFTDTREDYDYEVIASGTCHGRDVWIVGFEPRSPSGRTVRGRAWVLKDSFDVVRMSFLPARLPFVVTDASMVLDYGLADGIWVPVRFDMSMDLMLKVLVELMRRRIVIEDLYSDHVFSLDAGE
ncbi:hypothetical protein JXD38_11690 [candidate division WOR-3 bacterium]|nr:hypothetical protein [candidate division WOR-3 bacterium]